MILRLKMKDINGTSAGLVECDAKLCPQKQACILPVGDDMGS